MKANGNSTGVEAAEPLLGDFPAVTYDQWRQAVETELKGAPFDKKLVTRTPEGIDLQPLYRAADMEGLPHLGSMPGFAPFVRGGRASGYLGQSWEVSQELTVADPREFNAVARHGLSRGLTALNIVVDKATRNGSDPDWAGQGEVGVWGLSVATLADLKRAFDGIDLEKVSLFVRSGSSAMPFAALLAAFLKAAGKAPANLRGCIEMDPLGVLAHESRLPHSLKGAYDEMATLLRWASEHAPGLQTICVHGRSWHEGGGTAVHGLAFSLATGVEYLREMDARGLSVDQTAPRMRFALTVGPSFFMEIAKLRAARMLWAQAVAAAGGGPDAQRLMVHARTAQWNKTRLDPYVNMLRATAEAFAGVLGGCDSMQVGPFDEVVRQPDDFSRRIARNTQLILQKECGLDRLIDPAGGSWCVERLTHELARRAWDLFREVECRGGMAAAMRAGFPQEMVARAGAEKIKRIAQRRDVLVGVNQFANLKEKPLDQPTFDAAAFQARRRRQIEDYRTAADNTQNTEVLDRLSRIVEAKAGDLFAACIEAAASGATLGEITRAIRIQDQPDAPITPVCIHRGSMDFERLRGEVEAWGAKNGGQPKVFLAAMGPPKQHKARADFARGFFEPGGFETIYPRGLESVEAAAEAFAASGARALVVCSTDETYPEIVPLLARAARAKRPDALVVVAGYPEDQIAALKAAGVDAFIHIKADVLETLIAVGRKLDILPAPGAAAHVT